jgi:hypothetical protein
MGNEYVLLGGNHNFLVKTARTYTRTHFKYCTPSHHTNKSAKLTMKICLVWTLLFSQCAALVPAFSRTTSFRSTSTALNNKDKGGTASELDLPCEDECAIEKYPNLPASVHPGVLSGQAQLDLYKHAKENGEFGEKALRGFVMLPCLLASLCEGEPEFRLDWRIFHHELPQDLATKMVLQHIH